MKCKALDELGVKEHPLDISLWFLSQQRVPGIFRGGCLPSTQPKTVSSPLPRGQEVNARLRRDHTLQLFSQQGTADRRPSVH